MGIAASLAAIAHAIVGRPATLPDEVVARYPDLAKASWRRGGLPVRIGGWCLGRRSAAAITLWHVIWLAPNVTPSDELLLHELRHVDQFAANALFPFLYLWESARHGYVRNRFEIDARAYAAQRCNSARLPSSRG